MRSISMVSNEDGEKLRTFEMERQGKIKELLAGAVVTDVIFDDGCGISAKKISGLTLEKGPVKYKVWIEANQFYEVTETELCIYSDKGEIGELISMPTACDDCTVSDCKDRSTPGAWVVACKVKRT